MYRRLYDDALIPLHGGPNSVGGDHLWTELQPQLHVHNDSNPPMLEMIVLLTLGGPNNLSFAVVPPPVNHAEGGASSAA